MAEASTPTSSVGKAALSTKDKQCPFCQQIFTSSSLGRHLDLYIREKNPKPPDNKHDVQEIRKLRRNITRRQARNSRQRGDGSPGSSRATPSQDHASPMLPTSNPKVKGVPLEPLKMFMSQPSWQATGVINDLPQIHSQDLRSQRNPSLNPDANGGPHRNQEFLDILDQSRATELALKEVLESVRAANQLAHPTAPFDFNFFALTMPEMYLQCLAPPPSLLAEPSQRPYELAWSVTLPSTEQCEALRSCLASRLYEWRRRCETSQYGGAYPLNGGNQQPGLKSANERIKREETAYYEHLEDAFEKWRKLTDSERSDSWQQACAKAFAREQEKHFATQRKLDMLEQETKQLRRKLEHPPHANQTPEEGPAPTSFLTLSREAIQNLPPSTGWDYDMLISKWQARVQSARSAQRSLPAYGSDAGTLQAGLTNGHTPMSVEEHRGSWSTQDSGRDAHGDEDHDHDVVMNGDGYHERSASSSHLDESRGLGRPSGAH